MQKYERCQKKENNPSPFIRPENGLDQRVAETIETTVEVVAEHRAEIHTRAVFGTGPFPNGMQKC